MTQRVTSILLLALLLMASCTLVAPDVHYDWCYYYNFGVSDYGVNLISGTWVDQQGLTTDEMGLLQVNWTHDRFVQPAIVLVKAVRPVGVTGDITVTANANVFGIFVAFTETLPDGINEVTLNFQPDESGSGGTTVNAAVESSQPIAIQILEMRGQYASPFDVNYCGQITPEGTNATSIYTPDPSNTPEPPTDTPEPPPADWYWLGPFTRAVYNATNPVVWQYPDGTNMGFHPSDAEYFGIFTHIRDVSVGTPYHAAPGSMAIDVRSLAGQGLTASMVISSYGEVLTWVNDANVEFCSVRFPRSFSGLPDPDMDTVCAMISATGVRQKTANSVQATGQQRNALSASWSNQLTGVYFTVDVWYLYLGSPPPTITPTPTRTPLPTQHAPTPTPTRTPWLFPTRATNTAAPVPATSTEAPETPTGTYYPEPTAFITPTADPEGNAGTVENEAEWTIFDFIGYAWNEVKNGTYDILKFGVMVFYWVRGTAINVATGIDNIGKTLGGFFEGLSNLATDMYMTGQLTLDMSRLLLEISFGWFNEGITRINVVLVQFFNTPAISIPGLPQCISNPTEHQLCAIWWTLDWTLFAPATPGALIVPLLTIMLNVGIVLYFVQMVLKIVRKMGTITDV